MKLIIGFLSLSTLVLLSACSNTPETTTNETQAGKETTSPEPARSAAPAAKESKNSTLIGVDEDGVTYERKSGDNETKVEVTEDSKSVLIKK